MNSTSHDRVAADFDARAARLREKSQNGSNVSRENLGRVVGYEEAARAIRKLGDDTAVALMEARTAGGETSLWNQANLVGYSIMQGRLDGTNAVAVAAAIRATTPEEFQLACEMVKETP